MRDWPNSFWALTFMILAVVLAIVALIVPTQANVTMAVVAIASNIVSGAFGYISGHAAGERSALVSTGPNATINPQPPAEPAQPK
jgi:membrane protein YqaA with SNARE-associated domain